MAHTQKPDFVFRWNGRVHLNWRGRPFIRLLAAEVCTSAVVMVVILDKPCSKVVWRVLLCQFPLNFPSCASPCAITFQLKSTTDISRFKRQGRYHYHETLGKWLWIGRWWEVAQDHVQWWPLIVTVEDSGWTTREMVGNKNNTGNTPFAH